MASARIGGVIAFVVLLGIDRVVLIAAADADQTAAGSPGTAKHAGGGVDVNEVRLLQLQRPMHDRDLDAQVLRWEPRCPSTQADSRPGTGSKNNRPGRDQSIARLNAGDPVSLRFDSGHAATLADRGAGPKRGHRHRTGRGDRVDITAGWLVGCRGDVVNAGERLQRFQLVGCDDPGIDSQAVL